MVPENIYTPTTEGHWKFRGGGLNKIFKGKYEHKLEFLEGGGGQTPKNPPWGEYGYFLVSGTSHFIKYPASRLDFVMAL